MNLLHCLIPRLTVGFDSLVVKVVPMLMVYDGFESYPWFFHSDLIAHGQFIVSTDLTRAHGQRLYERFSTFNDHIAIQM